MANEQNINFYKHKFIVIVLILVIVCVLSGFALQGPQQPALTTGIQPCDNYHNDLATGYTIMQSSTFAVLSPARNIERRIPSLRVDWERFHHKTKDAHLFFYENGSSDRTREAISTWCDEDDSVTLVTCCAYADCACTQITPALPTGNETGRARTIETRITKMAFIRNKLQDAVKQSGIQYDYYAPFDSDFGVLPVHDGIALALANQDVWDAVFASTFIRVFTTRKQYDTLAYIPWPLPSEVTPHDCQFHGADNVCRPNTSPFTNLKQPKSYTRDTSLVRVGSAFNGFGLYKADAYLSATYGTGICEHVTFNMRLLENGYSRLFIALPMQLNCLE
jgi:hypothetical protein